ncbi:hypothetical protein DFH09DRAFT_1097823 [Mycena vulgaris]|nr:hypothetical protein DFH09DRAFT_1097823 [Mycena vulgaris]
MPVFDRDTREPGGGSGGKVNANDDEGIVGGSRNDDPGPNELPAGRGRVVLKEYWSNDGVDGVDPCNPKPEFRNLAKKAVRGSWSPVPTTAPSSTISPSTSSSPSTIPEPEPKPPWTHHGALRRKSPRCRPPARIAQSFEELEVVAQLTHEPLNNVNQPFDHVARAVFRCQVPHGLKEVLLRNLEKAGEAVRDLELEVGSRRNKGHVGGCGRIERVRDMNSARFGGAGGEGPAFANGERGSDHHIGGIATEDPGIKPAAALEQLRKIVQIETVDGLVWKRKGNQEKERRKGRKEGVPV